MSRSDRNSLALLETTLSRVDAAEQRAVSDLNSAGFRFRSLDDARAAQAEIRAAFRAQADVVATLARSKGKTP
ncbi:hypothetical protein [Microbacterium sp. Bi128]|uniref:hypothetical protein n=1 Tax=Microbacterium sp. Bi128 TaxID=2821115 RepID=UPI001E5F241D|nr:hypothetical protein [Microbacterium sp. Bi128]